MVQLIRVSVPNDRLDRHQLGRFAHPLRQYDGCDQNNPSAEAAGVRAGRFGGVGQRMRA